MVEPIPYSPWAKDWVYDQTPRFMTSRVEPSPPGIRKIWTNTLKSQIVERITHTAMIGRRVGTVTCQKRVQALAPSSAAASYSSSGTVVSPASIVTAMNGKPW